MEQTIFIIILAIVIFDFLLERYLSFINAKYMTSDIPAELQGVYDKETYAKQQEYKKTNDKFGMLTASFSFVLVLGMLLFNGFAIADTLVQSWVQNTIAISLIFFGLLFFVSDILGIPFDIYATFVIEEKYGFNKTTPKLFVFDKLKAWLLGAIIGGGLLALFIWFFKTTGPYFWLWFWGIAVFFMVFMTMFYSNIIVPLFNKQTPLEDGELRDAIEAFSQKSGFKLTNIYVIDGSKRSTKANAYFTGLGSKKRIVLFDTLIKQLSPQEIVAVLAHEIGHYKKRHTLSSMIISVFTTGLTLYILSLFINIQAFTEALGVKAPALHIGLISFGILYSPISLITGLIMNVLSRKNEYQADAFAASFGLADDLISALKKLSVNNLSNITPHPVYVFFHYSHPTLLQRIRALKK